MAVLKLTGADLVIQTRLSLDKVEGFRNENFEVEEILLYLNKAQSRLMDNLVNKNFEQGTLNYEWLRPFIVSAPVAADPAWGSTPNILFAPVTLPENSSGATPIMSYLISVKGTSSVSGVAGGSYDDGCHDRIIANPSDITNEFTKQVQIEISETGKALKSTHNSFYGSKDKLSPIAEAQGNTLIIYRDSSYILKDVILDYVGTLTEIVNDSSDIVWPMAAAQVLVDYAVEYMRLTINDPGYQGNVNDLNTRTQNMST